MDTSLHNLADRTQFLQAPLLIHGTLVHAPLLLRPGRGVGGPQPALHVQ